MTVHGRPSAVLLATEDLERQEETLAILRDSETVSRLATSDAELARVNGFQRRNWQQRCAASRKQVTGLAPDAPCTLRTTPTVRRALTETLPEAVAAAAYEFITGPLLTQPYRVGKRLLAPLDDRFSARRGTYRVIYRIDDKARVVTVVDVGHRRDIYRT